MTIEKFFREMRLSEPEKEKRIQLASDFEEMFVLLFWMIDSGIQIERIESPEFYYDFLSRRYEDSIEDFPFYDGESDKRIKEIVDTTFENLGIPYILSKDRATTIAENEANYIGNNNQFNEAKANGYTMKRWLSMRDAKVRHTHVLIDDKKIPIDDVFIVGGYPMKYPLDQSLGAPADEVVNCRCSLKFER